MEGEMGTKKEEEEPCERMEQRRWEAANLQLSGSKPASRLQSPAPRLALARVPVARSGWGLWLRPHQKPRVPTKFREQPGRQRRHLRGRAPARASR